MANLSKQELSIVKELSLTVYLDVYKQLIDYIMPAQGQMKIDEAVVSEVLDKMLAGDMVVNITTAINPTTPRTSVRGYLSSASNVDKVEIYELIHEIIFAPDGPTYFKPFRASILASLVEKVSRKKWSMGDVSYHPKLLIGELDNTVVRIESTTTMRLRNY